MYRLVAAFTVISCVLFSAVAADVITKRDASDQDVLVDGLLLGKDDIGNEYGLAYSKVMKKPVIEVKTVDGEVYSIDVDAIPKEALETLAKSEVEELRQKREVDWEGTKINQSNSGRKQVKRGFFRGFRGRRFLRRAGSLIARAAVGAVVSTVIG